MSDGPNAILSGNPLDFVRPSLIGSVSVATNLKMSEEVATITTIGRNSCR